VVGCRASQIGGQVAGCRGPREPARSAAVDPVPGGRLAMTELLARVAGSSVGLNCPAPTKEAAMFSYIDTRDVAAVAAQVLTSPGHQGKAYTLTGPEPCRGMRWPSGCRRPLATRSARSMSRPTPSAKRWPLLASPVGWSSA
jgi:hypothetical protein